MSKIIRIGTRDSELALWQAKTVQAQLEKKEEAEKGNIKKQEKQDNPRAVREQDRRRRNTSRNRRRQKRLG